MSKFRVALLANLKVNAPHFDGMAEDQWDDLDSEKTVNALVEAVRAGGHVCEFLEGDISLLDTVRKFKPDICFNICEGHFGDARRSASAGYSGDAPYSVHRLKSDDFGVVA